MNLTLTPLRLVLIAMVVGSLCFLFKNLVEANQDQCDSRINTLKKNCKDTNTRGECTQCFKNSIGTKSCRGFDNYADDQIQSFCQTKRSKPCKVGCNPYSTPQQLCQGKKKVKVKVLNKYLVPKVVVVMILRINN